MQKSLDHYKSMFDKGIAFGASYLEDRLLGRISGSSAMNRRMENLYSYLREGETIRAQVAFMRAREDDSEGIMNKRRLSNARYWIGVTLSDDISDLIRSSDYSRAGYNLKRALSDEDSIGYDKEQFSAHALAIVDWHVQKGMEPEGEGLLRDINIDINFERALKYASEFNLSADHVQKINDKAIAAFSNLGLSEVSKGDMYSAYSTYSHAKRWLLEHPGKRSFLKPLADKLYYAYFLQVSQGLGSAFEATDFKGALEGAFHPVEMMHLEELIADGLVSDTSEFEKLKAASATIRQMVVEMGADLTLKQAGVEEGIGDKTKH